MSLSDLIQHIPAQEQRIGLIPRGLSSETEACSFWSEFRESVWGKDANEWQKPERVDRGDDRVRDDRIPGGPPDFCTVATLPESIPSPWSIDSDKILVRTEYQEALRAAVLANNARVTVFVVGGQPGIGKSIFLLWLLMHRLALRLPTALQITSAYAILFHEGGVSEFSAPDNLLRYPGLKFEPGNRSKRIWALIDTNLSLREPSEIFRITPPFFVVNAVSPRAQYTDWMGKSLFQKFYMNPWSILEILQGRKYLGGSPHTERQLLHLHKTYGASTRDLCFFADKPRAYEVTLQETIHELDPKTLLQIFREPKSSSSSHYIITIRPSPECRQVYEKTIPSQVVFELLWDKHIRHRIDLMAQFHDLFLANPIMATSLGWIFELRMHQLLLREQTIRLFPMRGNRSRVNFVYSKPGDKSIDVQLTESTERPLSDGAKLRGIYYYRPNTTNCPAFDSLRLVHSPDGTPILLIFQMTRNKKSHDAKLRGLRKIDRLDLPDITHKYFVVVTPATIPPKLTIPVEYFEGGQDGQEDEETDEEDYGDADEEDHGDADEQRDDGMDIDDEQVTPDGEVFRVFHLPIPMDGLFKD